MNKIDNSKIMILIVCIIATIVLVFQYRSWSRAECLDTTDLISEIETVSDGVSVVGDSDDMSVPTNPTPIIVQSFDMSNEINLLSESVSLLSNTLDGSGTYTDSVYAEPLQWIKYPVPNSDDYYIVYLDGGGYSSYAYDGGNGSTTIDIYPGSGSNGEWRFSGAMTYPCTNQHNDSSVTFNVDTGCDLHVCYFDGTSVTEVYTTSIFVTVPKVCSPKTVGGSGSYHNGSWTFQIPLVDEVVPSWLDNLYQAEISAYNQNGDYTPKTYGERIAYNGWGVIMTTPIYTRTYSNRILVSDDSDDSVLSSIDSTVYAIKTRLDSLADSIQMLSNAFGIFIESEDISAEEGSASATTEYTICEIPSFTNWLHGYTTFDLASYDYIHFNGVYYDVSSLASGFNSSNKFRYYNSSSNGRYYIYLMNGSTVIASQGNISGDVLNATMNEWFPTHSNVSPSESGISGTPSVVTTLNVSLYQLILIQTIFIVCFIVFQMAWHTSDKFRKIGRLPSVK